MRLRLIITLVSLLLAGCGGDSKLSADCHWQDRDRGVLTCSFANTGSSSGSQCWVLALSRTEEDKFYHFNEEGWSAFEPLLGGGVFPTIPGSPAIEAITDIPPLITSSLCSGIVESNDIRDRTINTVFSHSSRPDRQWIPWNYCAISGWHSKSKGDWGCSENMLPAQ